MKNLPRIILASASPRRKQLLEWAELSFDVVVSDADETYPADLSIADVPVFIARSKAAAVAISQAADAIIVAADTIVVLNDRVIGKPIDRADAIATLQQLSGKRHEVITGVVIVKGKDEIAFADTTEVFFHLLTLEQIEFYVDKYHPYDKAGAYAIQEWIGVVGIQSVRGDFYNVMGLPVSRVLQSLQHFA